MDNKDYKEIIIPIVFIVLFLFAAVSFPWIGEAFRWNAIQAEAYFKQEQTQ